MHDKQANNGGAVRVKKSEGLKYIPASKRGNQKALCVCKCCRKCEERSNNEFGWSKQAFHDIEVFECHLLWYYDKCIWGFCVLFPDSGDAITDVRNLFMEGRILFVLFDIVGL